MTKLMERVSAMAARNIRRKPSLNNPFTIDPACRTCYYSETRFSHAGLYVVCTADQASADNCECYIREPGSDDG